MEPNNTPEQQAAVNLTYEYAVDLLLKQKKSPYEVQNALIDKGLDAESAAIVVNNLQGQIRGVKKSRGNKDMLYGALWCVGGIVATAADIGFIFWGAIVFGGIQFVKGAVNALGD